MYVTGHGLLPYSQHYPPFRIPPSRLAFSDLFAFQPTASTTVVLIYLLQMLTETNPYVVILALDFSEVFDSVRHAAVLEKYSLMNIPDNIYK